MNILDVSLKQNVLQNNYNAAKLLQKNDLLCNNANKKKKAVIIAGLTALAVSGICLAKNCKALSHTKTILPPLKLSNITFDKGIASINGKKFTGYINDILKNGDSIELKYLNGVLQSSSRTGVKNISKNFQYANNGKIESIITKSGETIREFIKTEKGHVIKENSKLLKAFLDKDGGKTVANFKNAKPISSKTFNKFGELCEKKLYEYDKSGKLKNIKHSKLNPYSSGLCLEKETIFSQNQIVMKSKHQIKTITKDKNQKYGADLSIKCIDPTDNSFQNSYYKNGKKLIEEGSDRGNCLSNVYTPNAHSQNGKFEKIWITDYRGEKPETLHKRVYTDGREDILKSGSDFGASDMEIEYRDKNGKTTGFLSSKYLDVKKRIHLLHGIFDQVDDVLITKYDKNHNPISSFRKENYFQNYSNYDFN